MDYNSLTVCGVLNGPDSCRAILCFCERIEWVSSGGETKFEGCVSMSEDRTSLSLLSLECSCLMAFFFLSLSSMKSWSMQPGSQHPNIWLTIWVECWGLQKRVSVWTLKWYLCLEQDCQGYRNAKGVMGCDILLDTFFFFPSWSLGVEFHLALLSIAKLFDFTHDLQKEILERWDLFSVSLICSELRG